MKSNLMHFFVSTALVTTLTACGDSDGKANPEAKAQKIAYAPILTNPGISQADIDLISSIKSDNTRRALSIIQNNKVGPFSADENNETALMMAAKSGNLEIVEAILDITKQSDSQALDRGNNDGKTALAYAAEGGFHDVIAALRKKGANANLGDKALELPVHISTRKGDLDSVRDILDNFDGSVPTNPDGQNGAGETAVLIATNMGNIPMLEMLKQYGANMNLADVQGMTPLSYSIRKNDMALFDKLIDLGADINYLKTGERTALAYAVENSSKEFVAHVLDKGADPNIFEKGLNSPLQIQVSQENADPAITELLIKKGAKLVDPNIPLGNVLTKAIKKGNLEVIKTLIKYGAKPSVLETPRGNAITQAIEADDPQIALFMIENGADVTKSNADSLSALALAARKGYKDVFEALVKKGADVNQTSKNKNAIPIEIVINNDAADLLQIMFDNGLKVNPDAALLRAVTEKKINIIPVMLKNGARPNVMNNAGQPALWLAVAANNIDAVILLVEAGAYTDVQDNEKSYSPLTLAVYKGEKEIATYLIEKGANPDLTDAGGLTSLAYAAATGQEDLVKLMIEKNAEVNATDKNGITIKQMVDNAKIVKDKKERIIQMLNQAGAK